MKDSPHEDSFISEAQYSLHRVSKVLVDCRQRISRFAKEDMCNDIKLIPIDEIVDILWLWLHQMKLQFLEIDLSDCQFVCTSPS